MQADELHIRDVTDFWRTFPLLSSKRPGENSSTKKNSYFFFSPSVFLLEVSPVMEAAGENFITSILLYQKQYLRIENKIL